MPVYNIILRKSNFGHDAIFSKQVSLTKCFNSQMQMVTITLASSYLTEKYKYQMEILLQRVFWLGNTPKI